MPARDFSGTGQPPFRLGNHPSGALDQRFKNECGIAVAFCPLCSETFFEDIQAFPVTFSIGARVTAFWLCLVERAPIAIRRHYFISPEQKILVRSMK